MFSISAMLLDYFFNHFRIFNKGKKLALRISLLSQHINDFQNWQATLCISCFLCLYALNSFKTSIFRSVHRKKLARHYNTRSLGVNYGLYLYASQHNVGPFGVIQELLFTPDNIFTMDTPNYERPA